MALKSVNIRIDEELKKQVEKRDPFYSEANMAHLKKSIEQLDQGKGKIHDIVEVEDEQIMV
ncbi:hypothetical protein [Clostridium sp.]|uniref:hypothetical protein n=1 Tax=Clostridium sp. TaxID=1506 RepID=UPI00258970A8|nr:hypothetical protein [Clostridium sp.]MDF2505189.1 hypothetical protein [Clostridium sp.]